jgi:hypothetical protein
VSAPEAQKGAVFGVAVPAFMGAIWLVGGLAALGRAQSLPIAAILIVSLVLFGFGLRATRLRTARPPRTPRDSRIFGAAVAFETIGAVGAVGLGNALGRADVIPPLVAIAVGLHFIPLARVFHRPGLYRTALVMVAGGTVALIGWTGDMREAVAALVAGAALWMGSMEIAWPALVRARA